MFGHYGLVKGLSPWDAEVCLGGSHSWHELPHTWMILGITFWVSSLVNHAADTGGGLGNLSVRKIKFV